MRDEPRFQNHDRLMRQMADANGVDLDLAVQKGEFDPEDYLAAVLACTGCSSPDVCEQHLRDGRSGVPVFCQNGETLRRLAGEAPSSG